MRETSPEPAARTELCRADKEDAPACQDLFACPVSARNVLKRADATAIREYNNDGAAPTSCAESPTNFVVDNDTIRPEKGS